MKEIELVPPFSWHGGKRLITDVVNLAFSAERMNVYAEPFFGGGAILLGLPRAPRHEVVCDLDGLVVNFWRSVIQSPEMVAHWATFPPVHHELMARRKIIREWIPENEQKLTEDPLYYDARIAGYWAWCLSAWIGTQTSMLATGDSRPISTLQGCLAPGAVARQGGIQNWIKRLADRLAHVQVLRRDWRSAVTPAQLCPHKNSGGRTGVYLDPPYKLTQRVDHELYRHDVGEGNDVARESYEWAVANGEKYMVAYSCLEGDFELPPGWWAHTWNSFGGNSPNRPRVNEIVMFSPRCRDPRQQPLF